MINSHHGVKSQVKKPSGSQVGDSSDPYEGLFDLADLNSSGQLDILEVNLFFQQ